VREQQWNRCWKPKEKNYKEDNMCPVSAIKYIERREHNYRIIPIIKKKYKLTEVSEAK
jgi:hypothetical protein